MNLSDVKNFLVLVVMCGVVIFGVVGIVIAPLFFCVQLTKGATVIYTGEIIATRQSTLLWEHTTIVMKTYAEEAITFTVEGLHEFDVNAPYQIETKGNFWRLYRILIDYQSLDSKVKIDA